MLKKITLLFVALVMLCLSVVLVALCVGSVHVAPVDLLHIIAGDADPLLGRIVLEIRLPRVMTGLIVGGMLALAGAMMQVLLRNPLAEPFILGISGGSAAFALLAIAAGVTGLVLNLSACAGACFTMLLVFVLSRAGQGWNPLRVLLTGVVISAGWGAFISLMLVVSPASRVHSMLFWLMGDLGFTSYSYWYAVFLAVILLLSVCMARSLNLLGHGDMQAAALGVNVRVLRLAIYFMASILTALAVMQAGNIGFIGLIIPHAIRMLCGSDHRVLIPASVIAGGTLLVLADTIARTVLAPQQLPVGVLTAFVGVPLFLLLLQSTAARQKT